MAERHRIRNWAALGLLLAGLAALGLLAIHLMRANAELSARLAGLESENRELRARSEKVGREIETLRREPESPRPAAPGKPVPRTAGGVPESTLEALRSLPQARENLAAARAQIAELQTRIHELEAAADKARQEAQRLAAAEEEQKEELAGTKRVLEAVQAELKGKDERVAQLEITNRTLHEQYRAEAEKTSRVPQLLRELEEVNRRRENFLNNILRRYREVTEQYRALAARLENPGEPARASTGVDLSRIQNTISMAEEDLRQLSSLNAQAERLRRKLTGK